MEIVDYAYPCMMAERRLKDAHDAVLHGDLDAAIEHTLQAIVDARLMLNSLKHMKEPHVHMDEAHGTSAATSQTT